MAYRHCRKCGWGYLQEEWEDSDYCTRCGASLLKQQNPYPPTERIEHIDPYPDNKPSIETTDGFLSHVGACRSVAQEHPYLFGTGSAVMGAAALMAVPLLVTVAHVVTVAGALFACFGVVGIFMDNGEDSSSFDAIQGGVLICLAGSALLALAQLLAIGGVLAMAVGGGVAAKAALEKAIRWQLQRPMQNKDVEEMLRITRQLEG